MGAIAQVKNVEEPSQPAQAHPDAVKPDLAEPIDPGDTVDVVQRRWQRIGLRKVSEALRARRADQSQWPVGIDDFAEVAGRLLVVSQTGDVRLTLEPGAKLGKRMLASTCTDPMVRGLSFAMIDFLRAARSELSSPEEIRAAEEDLAKMETAGDPGLICWRVARRIYGAKVNRNDSSADEIARARTRTQQAIVRACEQAAGDADQERLIVDTYQTEVLNAKCPYDEGLFEALDASGASVWLRGTLSGLWRIERAWVKRSHNSADKVSDRQWSGFVAELSIANERLREAIASDPSRPEPFAGMISVCGGGGPPLGESVELWLDRAITAQVDYGAAWSKALWFAAPRWNGSQDRVLKIGRRALNTKRFDSTAPAQYLAAVKQILMDSRGFSKIAKIPGIVNDLDALTAGYQHAGSGAAQWALSQCVIANVWLGREEKAKQLADTLGELFEFSAACSTWRMFPEQARMMYGYGERTGEAMRRVDAAVAARRWDEAQEAVTTLKAIAAMSEQERWATKAMEAHFRFARDWASNEWAALSSRGDGVMLCNVMKPGGTWGFDDSGAIAATIKDDWAQMVFVPEVGRRFEFAATVKDFAAATADTVAIDVRLDFDHETATTDLWQTLRIYPKQRKWVLGNVAGEEHKRPFDKVGDSVEIRIARFDNEVVVWFDGTLMYHGKLPHDATAHGTRIGFGFVRRAAEPSDVPIKLENARVRKLGVAPKELTERKLVD